MPAELIDVSGLSADAIHAVQSLVNLLRTNHEEKSSNRRDPEAWAKSLREWAASHAKRTIVIDDSRDRIYEGRGE